VHRHAIRRKVVAAIAGLALAGGLAVSAGPAAGPAHAATGTDGSSGKSQPAQAQNGLPIFTSTGAIVDPLDMTLPHNPTQEFIFPSVFHAGKHLKNPLAEWYVYYAPHDAPGGINLMYSDSLDGPWTQYEASPVMDNTISGFTVSHISSPDAFWNAKEQKLFMYFHGENTVTRFATSTDGVNFTYGGPIVSTNSVNAAQPGRSATETSYARVFEHPDPSSGYNYGMFFMANYTDNIRRINSAVSVDGRVWQVQSEPIVDPGAAEGTNTSAADFFRWHGKNYVIYGSTVGTIFAREINDTLTATGDPEPLFIPQAAPPEAGRATSPQIVKDRGQTHLIYEYGERSHTTIGHAILDRNGVRDPLNTHPSDPLYETCPTPGSDNFDGAALDTTTWNTIVRADAARHTVSDGSLRIPTYVGNSTNTPLILKDVPAAPWEVTTKVTLNPTENYQQAGLILRKNDANSARISISKAKGGQQLDFVWRNNGVDRIDPYTSEDTLPLANYAGTVWLRMTNNGSYLTAAYSLDGVKFANLGRSIPSASLGGTHVGAFAYRGTTGAPELTAEFDFIRFTPNAAELAACGG
jgi:regulation of enolase protein 1 (concanavalin A-like superfamily)